jgi:hypothetical protein
METSQELLSKSRIYIHELKMDMVPYSIALQALALEKANALNTELEHQLKSLTKLESELTNLFK